MRAVVRFRRAGWHSWPQAPTRRSYLRYPHRHLFHVEVSLEVRHHDREIEFHDLLEFCESIFHVENDSCESMAQRLHAAVLGRFGNDRRCSVSVFEDGEVGAVVGEES